MDHGPIGRQILLQEMHIHKLIQQPFTGITVFTVLHVVDVSHIREEVTVINTT